MSLALRTPSPTYGGLVVLFAAEGFLPGLPAYGDARAIMTDLDASESYSCPCCGLSEMAAHVFHRGKTHRLLLRCQETGCNGAVEF